MKMIEKYSKCAPQDVLDCRVKAIAEMVRNYGLRLTSPQVQLLGGFELFGYCRYSLENTVIQDIPYLMVSHGEVVERFFDTLDIKYEVFRVGNTDADFQALMNHIDMRTPILAKIVSGENGNRTQLQKPRFCSLSLVLLVGYDIDNNQALVIFANPAREKVLHEIPICDFQSFRNADCLPVSPKGVCYRIVEGISINRDLRIVDRTCFEMCRAAVLRMVEGGLQKAPHVDGGRCTDLSYGITGMREFEIDIVNRIGDFDGTKASLKEIRMMLLFVRNSIMHGSGTAFREEFGTAVAYVSSLLKSRKLEDKAREIQGSGRLWKSLFVELSRAGYSEFTIEKMDDVLAVWREITKRETRLLNEIYSILIRHEYN
jgi:hypothetical protein